VGQFHSHNRTFVLAGVSVIEGYRRVCILILQFQSLLARKGHVVTACTHQRSPVNGNGPPARPDDQDSFERDCSPASDVPLPRRVLVVAVRHPRCVPCRDAKIPPRTKDIPHVTSPMITKHIHRSAAARTLIGRRAETLVTGHEEPERGAAHRPAQVPSCKLRPATRARLQGRGAPQAVVEVSQALSRVGDGTARWRRAVRCSAARHRRPPWRCPHRCVWPQHNRRGRR